jgi:hypothetical protein
VRAFAGMPHYNPSPQRALILATPTVEYCCLTDLSGKLRRVFRAEPGTQAIDAAVSEVQPRFEEEIAFWKRYFGIT